MVKGSVGSNAYRHFHATIDGAEVDTMRDGEVACAYFVSSILTIFGGLDSPSFVVGSVENKLINKGWHVVDSPEPGDILVYEDLKQDDEVHAHIGFYIGNDRAVSNSWTTKTPLEHDWLYRDSTERKVTSIYRGQHILIDTMKEVK